MIFNTKRMNLQNKSRISFFRLMQKTPQEERLESSIIEPKKIFKISLPKINFKKWLRRILIVVIIGTATYAALNLIFKVLPLMAAENGKNKGKANAAKDKQARQKGRKKGPGKLPDYSGRAKGNPLPGENWDTRIGRNGEYLNHPDSLPSKINSRVENARKKFGLDNLGPIPNKFYEPSMLYDIFPNALFIGFAAGLLAYIIQEAIFYFNKNRYPNK